MRHILVDTLGLPIANRVEAADVSDPRAGALLTSGLKAMFPAITTVIADAGHESKNSPAPWQSNKAGGGTSSAPATRLQNHGLDLDRRAELRLVGTQSSAQQGL